MEMSDTGIGMSEAGMRRVLRTFYSGKPRKTSPGFPFCRWVVEELGGEITANSRPEERNTFIVSLPVRTVSSPPSGKRCTARREYAPGNRELTHRFSACDDLDDV